MTHYRDPLAGLLSQVATKRGLALDRDKRVTPILRALLPPRIEQQIAEHRGHALDETADSMETLSRVDASLDALSSVLEEALLLEDDARTLTFEVSDPPRPEIPPPWLIEEDSQLRFRNDLQERVAQALDDEISLLRWGDFGYLTRFRRGGSPHVLHVEAGLDSNKLVVVAFTATLRTTMPERVPELDLRAQGPHHAVGKALGLATEMETGDSHFDETYWIKGHRGALAFLTRELRGLLLAFAPRRPRLRFHRGSMSLEWTAPWRSDHALHLDEALDVVARIHALVARG